MEDVSKLLDRLERRRPIRFPTEKQMLAKSRAALRQTLGWKPPVVPSGMLKDSILKKYSALHINA